MSNSTREMKVSEVMECAEAYGMVGLPRDVDGEPIHIGDLMALGDDQVGRRTLCDMIANLESDLEDAKAENAKLRELVRDMWHEGMCECGSRGKCASCEYDYPTRMRELGIELNDYE